jgi:uncharacterized protein (TIGR03435 family)
MRALAAVLVFAICAHAQPAPRFEVASVKMSPPRHGTAAYTALDADPAMVRYSNITLVNLLANAYHIDSTRISGPAWIDETPYDIQAKLPAGTPKDQVWAMLQALLTERFKLTVRKETKEQKAYLLVVGKNGPKLKKGRPEGGQNQMLPGRIMGGNMPMSMLAALLTRFAGYPVVDKTGLQGTYDIDLKFAKDTSDLAAAVQEQLGLRLETGKAPVETLVVDRAERVPVEN